MSQFCTAVDVLARVVNKQLPPPGRNGHYFRACARTWLGFSAEEARQLWSLRNGISHGYKLERSQQAAQFGHGRPIRHMPSGQWVFYLHAMYSTLGNAKNNLYQHLSSEPIVEKQRTARYLINHGFYFTR